MKKDRAQEWRNSLNILTNCMKTITKAELSSNTLNDKITRFKDDLNGDFNLFFYYILPSLINHVISN